MFSLGFLRRASFQVLHTHTQMHLMTPQGHLVHLALVYGQSLHLCGKIIKFSIYFLFFYLTKLELLDTTSQRKLAHIQRFILLNYHLILLQIYLSAPVPWQYATSQYYWSQSYFIIIFIFFQNTVVSMQLGKIPTLGSCTKINHCTTHTWMRMTILAC